ncbi:hypothetical protein [Nocardia arizonensis]|uniref:hypothetical protein n=1 Tax=Nocardia arizonensis TaxID=1141647 RepID=UPI0006D0D526|nr:hypothetical protein [Nocardia arizonensis]
MGISIRASMIATLLALTGCDAAAEPVPPPTAPSADAEVVAFDASGFNGPPFAAVVDSPSAARYFAGWFAARAARSSSLPEVVAHPEKLTDLDTYAYIAYITSTGCRLPDRAELRREGASLRPDLLGGVDHQECYRAYTPFVVYKVRRADLDGVTAIGSEPVDRGGPAETVSRVELAPAVPTFTPREITAPAPRTALADELAAAGGDAAKIRTALDATSRLATEYRGNGVRRYAFPVRACPDDRLVLLVTATEVRAEAIASPDAPRTCEAPTSHLAVFDVRETYVPNGARLIE